MSLEALTQIMDHRGSVLKFDTDLARLLAQTKELYFSTMRPGSCKNWKLHTERHTNLVCLRGKVRIEVRARDGSRTVFKAGTDAPALISIPKGHWFRMRNDSLEEESLILSLADGKHDYNEAIRLKG